MFRKIHLIFRGNIRISDNDIRHIQVTDLHKIGFPEFVGGERKDNGIGGFSHGLTDSLLKVGVSCKAAGKISAGCT